MAALVIGCLGGFASVGQAQEIWNWDAVIRGTGCSSTAVPPCVLPLTSPLTSTDVWLPTTSSSQTLIIDPLSFPIDATENSFTQELLITDTYNHRVLRFDSQNGAFKGEVNGTFVYPYGVAADAVGNILVTDWQLNTVQAFAPNGDPLAAVPWNNASVPISFNQPWSVVFTPGSAIFDNNPSSRVLIVDSGNNRVLTFGTDGHLISSFGSQGSTSTGQPAHGQFDGPVDLALRPVSGIDPSTGVTYTYPYQLYIADLGNNRVQVLTPDGVWLGEITGLSGMQGVTVDANGRVLVADTYHNRIAVFSKYPNFTPVNVQIGFPSLGTNDNQISCNPGANGTDPNDPRVFAQIPGTTIIDPTQCAPGALQGPTNIGLDSTGRLIVIDSSNARVERFNHPAIAVTADATNSSVAASAPIVLNVIASAASGSFAGVSASVVPTCRDQFSASVDCSLVLAAGPPSITPASGTVAQSAPLAFTVTYTTLAGVSDKAVTFVATVSNGSVSATSLASDPVRIGFTGTALQSKATPTPAVPSTGWWVNSAPTIVLTATGNPAPDLIEWALTGDGINTPAPGSIQTSCTGAGPCTVPVIGEVQLYLWYRARGGLQTESWHTMPVNVELTKPAIEIVSQTPTPCDTCAGWVNRDVVTTYLISNSISGNKTITPAPAVVNNPDGTQTTIFQLTASGEGTAVSTPTLTVVDNAGLQTTAAYTSKIDKTPPTILTGTRTAATNGIWNHAAVTVTFTANDPKPAGVDAQSGFPLSLSGSATPFIGDPNGKFVTVVSTEGAGQSVTAGQSTFIDLAGNVASNSVTVSNINIDVTPPTITPTFNRPLPASGWFNASTTFPVTVTFTATDTLSGMTGTTTQTVSIANNAANQGTHPFSSSTAFSDVAGNTAPNATINVSVDTALPTLAAPAIVGPIVGSLPLVPNGFGFFDLTGLPPTTGVTVNLTAADAAPGSGIQSVCYDLTTAAPATPTCTPVTLNGTVYPLTVLSTTTVARAWVIDNAGNQSAFQSFSVKITRSTPVANAASISPLEDTAFSGMLTQTGAAPGATLTYAIAAQPAHGTVTLTAATGAFTYAPAANYNGLDSFTFTVSDGSGASQPGKVSITLIAVNDAPTFTPGANQTVALNSGARSVVWATAISAGPNETTQVVNFIVSNDTNALFSVQPAIATDGTLTFTPANGATGTATVTVRLHDDGGVANGGVDASAPVTFTITVSAVNQLPVAVADAAVTTVNTAVLVDVLANDSDPDGDTLTIQSVTSPTKGGQALITGGRIKYTPKRNLTRGKTDTFTYTISDGRGGTATATVTITIINSAPVAVADTASTFKGEPVTIRVLSNDFDADKDELTIIATTAPTHGTIRVNEGDTITYTPVARYEGTDAFTYTISDGHGGTATATVTVTMKKHFDGDGCEHDRHRNSHHDDDDSDHDRDTRRGGRDDGGRDDGRRDDDGRDRGR